MSEGTVENPEIIRCKALIPNANTSQAEAIRRRTICYLCRERILTGQPIVITRVRGEKDKQVHESCYNAADERSM